MPCGHVAEVNLLDSEVSIHGEQIHNSIMSYRADLEAKHGDVWP